MEHEEHFDEEEYISGFNQGYFLAKEFPEVADILNNATGKSYKFEGLRDGRQQYLEEVIDKESKSNLDYENRPTWLSDKRFSEHTKNEDKEVDKFKDVDKEDY
jgi:hypothetical protein